MWHTDKTITEADKLQRHKCTLDFLLHKKSIEIDDATMIAPRSLIIENAAGTDAPDKQ